MYQLRDEEEQIVSLVREFARKEIKPIAHEYEAEDRYPHTLVAKMKEMGLFGLTVPEEYGGIGLSVTAYARVFEEISKVWMSVAGILGTHGIVTHCIKTYGTDEQKQRYLPALATGEVHGALGLTEPNAGSDVQAISTVAERDGDHYILNGAKTFITNSRNGTHVAVLAKTDRKANPPYKGMSLFMVDKRLPGFQVSGEMKKLGYKGLDTCELVFENVRVPATDLLGGAEGRGFHHVMSGLEVGRINVAARAVGVAQAAFEDSIKYAQERKTFGVAIADHQAIQLYLAEMATKIEAARLLTLNAAAMKDRGERCDMEAGMAKFFASEICAEVSMIALRIHGGYGYTKEYDVERYYRDAPLMIIGEGTNEIQRLVIARNLLKRYSM